jgi:hypothetical protein
MSTCAYGMAQHQRCSVPRWLVDLVVRVVQESGDPSNFDARRWAIEWIEEFNPALGGRRPKEFLSSAEGRSIVAGLILKMQSGAYA